MKNSAIITRGLITEHVDNAPNLNAIHCLYRLEYEIYFVSGDIFCHLSESDFEVFRKYWPGNIEVMQVNK